MRATPQVRDKHLLYSAAVQSPDTDLEFFLRVFRRERGRTFRTLREDFCGTAALACEWVRSGPDRRAWGVDLDGRTLDWGRRRYVSRLGEAAERIELIRGDVREARTPPVEVVAALNFSFCVFKTREELGGYFRSVHAGLDPDGLFFLDLYGGTESMTEETERRRIAASRAFDGTRIPAFTYVWEQAAFNPIDHHAVCQIHFDLAGGVRLQRAFRYDWRLWTLPEVRELLLEAGFARADVYVEGWDDDADEADGVFRRRVRFQNQSGWIGYVVGIR